MGGLAGEGQHRGHISLIPSWPAVCALRTHPQHLLPKLPRPADPPLLPLPGPTQPGNPRSPDAPTARRSLTIISSTPCRPGLARPVSGMCGCWAGGGGGAAALILGMPSPGQRKREPVKYADDTLTAIRPRPRGQGRRTNRRYVGPAFRRDGPDRGLVALAPRHERWVVGFISVGVSGRRGGRRAAGRRSRRWR